MGLFDIFPLKTGPLVYDWRQVVIGLGNGLAPNGRQAIIWPNHDPVQWRKYSMQY